MLISLIARVGVFNNDFAHAHGDCRTRDRKSVDLSPKAKAILSYVSWI